MVPKAIYISISIFIFAFIQFFRQFENLKRVFLKTVFCDISFAFQRRYSTYSTFVCI